ncbi:MAG TPA: hypothetical protein HPQ03_02720 [Deltaproteobacteria bacterium]|nr:hypothetical protein [Deltaproteobacteria bacterium]
MNRINSEFHDFLSKLKQRLKLSGGEIGGDAWEKYCQKLLKLKYNDYQEVPARYAGDLGVEGFTHTGIAFQCYCQDGEPISDELYEKQRDKVTKDIKGRNKQPNKMAREVVLTDVDSSEC